MGGEVDMMKKFGYNQQFNIKYYQLKYHYYLLFPHLPVFEADEIAFLAKLKPSADPIAMDVHCLFWDADRSSTRPLASYPGTEHNRIGVPSSPVWILIVMLINYY